LPQLPDRTQTEAAKKEMRPGQAMTHQEISSSFFEG